MAELSTYAVWICPARHLFQARDDDDPQAWRATCKRCPVVAGESRPLMRLVDVAACGSFDDLVAIAQHVLDERYPADVPLVCDRESPDPGPRLAAALRDVLAVRA